MKVEKFTYLDFTAWNVPGRCKEFVYKRRNIFGTTRLYIENTYPVVIKEISTSPDGKTKHYLYWVFYPDYYVIYHFEKKPTKKEWSRMWTEIQNSIEPLNARILHKNEEARK